MKRTAFFISDGTGITAETLGQSLLAQFENIQFTKLLRPYVDTVEKARDMVQQINAAAEKDAARPIIFDTVVNSEIRQELAKSNGYMIDIFSTMSLGGFWKSTMGAVFLGKAIIVLGLIKNKSVCISKNVLLTSRKSSLES